MTDVGGRLRLFEPDSLVELSGLDPGIGPLLQLGVSPDDRRVAVLGTKGLRLLGGALPKSRAEAERRGRQTFRNGALALLEPEAEAALLREYDEPAYPPRHDPPAARFFELLAAGGLTRDRPHSWLDWLFADASYAASPEMSTWLGKNPTHPLAHNPSSWLAPR